MNGSEKQIQWANDIKAQVVNKVIAYRDYYQGRFEQKGIAADDPRWETITEANSALALIEQQQEAKWFINNLRNFGKPFVKPQVMGFAPIRESDEGGAIVELVNGLARREARKARQN